MSYKLGGVTWNDNGTIATGKLKPLEALQDLRDVQGWNEIEYTKRLDVIEEELKEREQYKVIEEELGIDLLTLLSILMEKRTFFHKWEDGTITEDNMDGENIYGFCKDYGKTWALTKEELL